MWIPNESPEPATARAICCRGSRGAGDSRPCTSTEWRRDAERVSSSCASGRRRHAHSHLTNLPFPPGERVEVTIVRAEAGESAQPGDPLQPMEPVEEHEWDVLE